MKSPIQSFTIQSCSFHRSSFRHSAETEEKCCNLSSIKKSSEASRVIGANGNFRPIHENFIRLWLGFNGVIWGYCWDFFLFLCFLFDGFFFLWFFFFFFFFFVGFFFFFFFFFFLPEMGRERVIAKYCVFQSEKLRNWVIVERIWIYEEMLSRMDQW